jgi:Cdc6-like AAA superfamily ATPase
MIVIFKGRQRQYKTTSAVATVLELVLRYGYETSDIVSNIHLFKPIVNENLPAMASSYINNPENYERDVLESLVNHCLRNQVRELENYHYLRNSMMVKFISRMVNKGLKHRIILIDEIDRVFPHRFWQDKVQTEALLGLWQDEKLFNWIIGTAHLGLGIDKQIRESCQIEIISECGIKGKTVDLTVFNALDMDIFGETLENIPLVQRIFYSWEAVKVDYGSDSDQ